MYSLGRLPLEVIQLILDDILEMDDLRRCVLVNKHFYEVLNPKLWRSPSIRNLEEWTGHTSVAIILYYLEISHAHHTTPLGHHIRTLKMTTYDSIQDILSLLAFAPLVEDVSLFTMHIGDEELDQIVRLCPNLKVLELGYLSLTDSSMDTLAHQCPNLCDLSLNNLPKLTFETFLALKDLPLERIYISQCPGLLTANSATQMATYDQLTSLRLFEGKNGLSSDFMKQLVPSTPYDLPPLANLKEFVAEEKNPDLDDSVLVAFIRSHSLLETLVLYADNLDLSGIHSIGQHLPRLKNLALKQMDGPCARAMRAMIMDCKRLECLELYYGGHFSKELFPEISDEARNFGVLELEEIIRIRLNTGSRMEEQQNDLNGENSIRAVD